MTTTMAAFAELERDVIHERTKVGCRSGRPGAAGPNPNQNQNWLI